MAGAFKIPLSLQKSVDATKVEYVQLGASGLRVSFPILGAMGLSTAPPIPWVLNEEASLKLLNDAYDCGINTIDTANSYSNGASEEVIGKAIRQFNIPRHKLVILTKVAHYVGEEPDVMAALFPEQMSRSKDYVNQEVRTNPMSNATTRWTSHRLKHRPVPHRHLQLSG
jgi:aryl-alcohol dehydrogenase-like predicted oxidoreductase